MPTDKGAHAKIGSLVTGMVAGADSITDMALLRHGAMGTVVDRPYAPSTLGSFLREFTFGHVRQLDAVASRFLGALAARAPVVAGIGTGRVLVDIDDSVIESTATANEVAWNEVPESSAWVVRPSEDEIRRFEPISPT